MWTLKLLLCLIFGTVLISSTTYSVKKPTAWWQTMTVYQIWIRAFKDSDGDGIGDLKGITSKLDHMVDMGVDAIWITPIYGSPFVDSGYDVSDYFIIDPTYGTFKDFDKLVATAKKHGIKVFLDFVPNHTSDQHSWFKKSKAGIEPYTDYYVWNEGKIDANGTRQPPNNWISNFGGTAWEWFEERQAYLLHQFTVQQPDLNFRNPQVIQETKDILTFWLDRGIDGFRIDAMPYLIEEAHLADEPVAGREGLTPTDYFYLSHIYTKDLEETYDILRIWKDHVNNYAHEHNRAEIALLTEGYANISRVMEYYNTGSDIPFNIFFIRDEADSVTHLDTADDIVEIITLWMRNMPENKTANWQLGNHDNHRIGTKAGPESIDGFNFILFLLPGVATIYNGDEIGMIDANLTWEQTQDPQACSAGRATFREYSRDPQRTPYQWDNTTSAGFSKNTTTVLPVNTNYLELNLAAQKEADVSHYKNVQAAIALRKTKVFREGNLNIEVIDDDVIAFSREYHGELPIVVLMNYSNTTAATISLDVFENVPNELEVLIADINSGISVGDVFEKTSIELPSKAAVVLRGIECIE